MFKIFGRSPPAATATQLLPFRERSLSKFRYLSTLDLSTHRVWSVPLLPALLFLERFTADASRMLDFAVFYCGRIRSILRCFLYRIGEWVPLRVTCPFMCRCPNC